MLCVQTNSYGKATTVNRPIQFHRYRFLKCCCCFSVNTILKQTTTKKTVLF